MADAPKILESDTMKQSLPKLNQSIANSNKALIDSDSANLKANQAVTTAYEAVKKSDSVKSQLDNIIISKGESDAEVLQARGDFSLLSERLGNTDAVIEETISKVDERELKNRIFRKKVYLDLPLRFPDYNTILSFEDASYMLSQSFTIDWETKELFLVYEPGGGTSTKRWIVIYDIPTKKYKRCFHAGNSGGEGIVVKKEGYSRFMYVKSKESTLGKYNITTYPQNLTSINPVAEYDVGLAFDFSYLKGLWLVEQGNAAYGTYQRRTAFGLFNDSFQRVGSVDVAPEIGGYFSSPYQSYIPKRQGVALGEELIYQATGGNQKMDQAPAPYGYHGLKILDYSGKLIQEGVVDPFLMADKLTQMGYYVDRIESEGAHLSPSGDLYSLMVHVTDLNSQNAGNQGIIIFKELCGDEEGVIDFSSISRNYFKINNLLLENGAFPRHANKQMHNPYTGEVLDTFDKILDFMSGVELKKLSFFSNEVTVKDINGTNIPANTYVSIQNANNYTFVVDFYGRTTSDEYIIYGNSGERVQAVSRSSSVQNHKMTEDDGSVIYKYDESFNNHKTTGFYYKKSTDSNNPINQYGFLDVRGSAVTCVQIFYPVASNRYFWRTFNDNSWSSWTTVSGS
ncbi:pyocin knob domain-containing protein [Rossellomorea marisflavi]|uniref:pyocin knob domain-containing protein n=1 Tax=Rossellomorea marisflavi TaxID=189381 RepID=UPI00345DB83B